MNSEPSRASVPRRTADATPHAASLIQSLRDIGYSAETALADIIDNSITAGARHVEILSEANAAEPAIAILDDGRGMSMEQLIEAMRPGSSNPLDARDAGDLGRFGLGLKSKDHCLLVQPELTNFVQEQHAAIGRSQKAGTVGNTETFAAYLAVRHRCVGAVADLRLRRQARACRGRNGSSRVETNDA